MERSFKMGNLDNKVILTVAPTGAWPSKNDTPYVPLQPREIADEIYACWKAGASVAHIHVRDDEDKSSMDLNKFVETVKYIRETDCDIVLNLTTSGQLGLEDEDRMKHIIELKPELASYDCGSMNWLHTTVFENSPSYNCFNFLIWLQYHNNRFATVLMPGFISD